MDLDDYSKRAIDLTCRLCGQPRAIQSGKKPVPKEKYQEVIVKCTGLDVQTDHKDTPAFVCTTCISKLSRSKSAMSKRANSCKFPKWNIPVFDQRLPAETSGHQQTEPSDRLQPGTTHESQADFNTFKGIINAVAKKFGYIECSTDDTCVFVRLVPGTGEVFMKLIVNSDFTWTLHTGSVLVNPNFLKSHGIPDTLDNSHCESVFKILSNSQKCLGNVGFECVINAAKKSGLSVLVGKDFKTVIARIDGDAIHSIDCDGLTSMEQKLACFHCKTLRSTLRARSSNIRKTVQSPNQCTSTSVSSRVPFSKLSPNEKSVRLSNIRTTCNALQKKVKRLEVKVKQLVEAESVELNPIQHKTVSNVMESHGTEIEKWPEGTPQRILWDQQCKYMKCKSGKGMRWHPLIIRWCISLLLKSPAAYNQLANSGFLSLPHVTTLRSYMRFAEPTSGANAEVLKLVIKEFGLPDTPASKQNVVLSWDEMKIKSGLAFSNSGKVIGYCNMDSFSEELAAFAQEGVSKPEVATHILVMMVRGIVSNVGMPFMWYPCTSSTSESLWGTVWGATSILESIGLKVRAWTCDGAAPNRKFFHVHSQTDSQVTYKAVNRFDQSRVIYFVCDVPHLLKTTRNNLANSHGHLNSRHLVKNEQTLKWSHIVSTVETDKAQPISKLVKIKEEHIHLTPQLRMRVKLAAQVLSSSMSNAIICRNRPEMMETAKFCKIFDQWFDCLNGRYLLEHVHKRKPELAPYTSVNDWRFTWLQDDFLGYLDDWEKEIGSQKHLTRSEKNKLLLSSQTMEGLRISTLSFIGLVRELLCENTGLFIMAEKLNQDRLEIFFSKMRSSTGSSDNPNVYEVGHRFLALLLAGGHTVTPRTTNCENVNLVEWEQGAFPLKRRKIKNSK